MYIKRDVLRTWNSDNIEKSIKKCAGSNTATPAWIKLLDGYISEEEVWQELYQIAARIRDTTRPDSDDEYNVPDFIHAPYDMVRLACGSMQGRLYWGMIHEVIEGETPEPIAWRNRLEKEKRDYQEKNGLVPYA